MSEESESRWLRATVWLRRNSGNALLVTVAGAVASGVVTVGIGKLMEDEKPPTCPGEACDGRNPQDEGCGSDADSWMPTANNPVALEIRYSAGCHAAWGRINAGEFGDRVMARVIGGSVREATISYGNDQFTRMAHIADPGDFRIEVCAVPVSRSGRRGTWQQYCIEATEATAWR